jgi:phosphate transport system substrate-binding protein
MIHISRVSIAFAAVASCLFAPPVLSQEQQAGNSIQEIRAALDAIDPYLPGGEVTAEVDVFGSTSMDTLAHGWASGFKKFHPKAEVVVSAEGSETVFKRLAANPASVGMLSRPVTDDDLAKLKQSGLKKPIAVMVAREALGVFVHESNPLNAISYQQLVDIFCDPTAKKPWSTVGVTGPLADKPIELIGRDETSGTHKFLKDFVFAGLKTRAADQLLPSNAKVVKAIEESPLAIAICGLKCGSHAAKPLHLREKATVFQDDDHAILMGGYPLTRPLTLVIDAGQTSDQAKASQAFVRYALAQAGQMQAILSGFFPFDPPTLRAESLKLGEAETGKQ